MQLDARRCFRSLPARISVILLVVCPPLAAQELIFADGFEDGTTSAWSQVVGLLPPSEPFRFADLDLRDPHVFADVPVIGCVDFTDDAVPGVGISFNDQLATSITTDGNGDGFLDLSILVLLRPLDQTGSGVHLALRKGICTDPLATTMCSPDPLSVPQYTNYNTQQAGTCLEPGPGTTSGYIPTIGLPVAQCFVSQPVDLALDVGGLVVPLQEGRLAATFVGDPAGSLQSGLLAGFLTEAEADALIVPPNVPFVGGQPLSTLLPGGTGCCAPGDDRDTYDGATGWWFYLNFDADEVPYDGN